MPVDTPPASATLSRLLAALARERSRVEACLAAPGGLAEGEALHDLRVALRRTAALARLSRDFPAAGAGRPLREAARDLRRALSDARTDQVCRLRLLTRFSRDPARREAARALAARLPAPPPEPRGRRARLLRALRAAFVDRDRALVAGRVVPAAAETAAAETRLAREIRKRVRRQARSLAALLPPEAATLHRSRIAAKELRYALEFAAGAEDGTAANLLRHLRAFQEAAGDAHDRQELVSLVKRASLGANPRVKRGALSLVPVLERDALRGLEAAAAAGRRLARPLAAFRRAARARA